MADELGRALHRLSQAVLDHGPSPTHHYQVMERHRAEWPSLWAAIDDVVAADLEVQFEHRTARQAAMHLPDI